MLGPSVLVKISTPIGEKQRFKNKYTYLSYKRYPQYRYLTLNDLFKNKITKKDIPSHIFDFIAREGEVLLIANVVSNVVVNVQLRSFKTKTFLAYGSQSYLFYGFGYLSPNFKYGDPVVIVEGTVDADYLRTLYPNVMACMTAGMSSMQLNLLKYLTDYVVLAYDNDDAGRRAVEKDKRRLINDKFRVEVLNHPDVKDPGDVLQLKMDGDDFEYQIKESYYKTYLGGMLNE